MKNLFKNLMLVAVAAMAFTACTETNEEVNAVSKVTRYEFTANIADETRSGFGDKVGTAYPSHWDGDETLKVCANGSFTSAKEVNLDDAEGHFSVELTGNPTFIDVYSPASAWSSVNFPTVPAVQTPRANSVDPAAHILKAEAADVNSGMVTMHHKVAYGKMTVNTPDGFEISKVELSLVGLPNEYWTENQTYSYTLNNAGNVEGNTFWFATEELGIVKEFTVTAYNAGGDKYAKTVTGLAQGKLGFVVGKVSTFSVSNLETVVAPEEPEPEPTPDPSTAPKFAGAKMYYSYGYTDKKIQLTGDGEVLHNLIFNLMGNTAYTYVSADSTYLNAGTYDTDSGKDSAIDPGYSTYNNMAIDDVKVTVEHVDEGYYIVVENVVVNDNVVIPMATYTGLIDGFSAPWASVGNEPDEPSGDVIELTITEHSTIYTSSSEHELAFYYIAGSAFVDIDFLANPIVPGTYDLINGLSGMYCKSHGADMQECKVVVTDAGDGKLTFDATFKVNDQKYHFVYTAKIYS